MMLSMNSVALEYEMLVFDEANVSMRATPDGVFEGDRPPELFPPVGSSLMPTLPLAFVPVSAVGLEPPELFQPGGPSRGTPDEPLFGSTPPGISTEIQFGTTLYAPVEVPPLAPRPT